MNERMLQQVYGDFYDVFCVYSHIEVAICACSNCAPIKHAARNRYLLDLAELLRQ